MVLPLSNRADRVVQPTLAFLHEIFRGYGPLDFTVELWDGTRWEPAQGRPSRFTMVLRHPGTLRKMFWRFSELSLGEAFIHGDFDVEGDLGGAFRLADYFRGMHWGVKERLRYSRFLLTLPSPQPPPPRRRPAKLRGALHSVRRDRSAVAYHYDVSNRFYELWLDRRMVYSTGYFHDAAEDLDTAQERKLDYVCRKLRLRGGERMLDIGCGWGALVLHAARNYGVEAVGITLSRAQAELANERIREAGMEGRCRVAVEDYRTLGESGRFDKIASVGMFEHVGRSRLGEYFGAAWRLLRPGGAFLNHGIAAGPGADAPAPAESFVDRYVFPDGDLFSVSLTLRAAEECGFEVRDVECLREHYILTLRHWVRRLEEHMDEACRATDDVTCRIWRLYMTGSAHAFETGRNSVYQVLLSKADGGKSGMPLTRADWYS
jgi:cyclopropane-fatty-acyl-phospholipid synthase